MEKIRKFFSRPRTTVNICFILVLIFVGLLLNNRLKSMLYSYTELQVAKQSQTIAEKTSSMFGVELAKLNNMSDVVEKNENNDLEKVMASLNLNREDGMTVGLLSPDGHTVYGEAFAASVFPGIQTSFRGIRAISYNKNAGLLFTSPVYNGENIKYVIYEYCPPECILKNFKISCFDGFGKALVVTKDEEIIVPFENATVEDIDLFYGKEFGAVYNEILKSMEVNTSTSRRITTNRGDYYLFASEIPETDFFLAGFVDSEAAAKGAYDIVLLVGRVFELITVLFTIGSIYIIVTSNKVNENDELIKAKKVAEEASKAKSDFLASMSHEIRTPINAILGMDEMILREYDDETLKQYALNIRNAGNNLLTIINDILDFSKIESGKMQLVPVDYDTSLMIYDLVSMIRSRAEQKGLTFVVRADENIPRMLFGDNIRLKQCILNILTNAVKYTDVGSVVFSVGYDKLNDRQIKLRVAVKDTGIGIKKEDIERLFSPFERADETRNRSIEGTGLGMSIVKQLLAMMDSTLKVESEYGKGSEFSFEVVQEVRNWMKMGNYENNFIHSAEITGEYRETFKAPDAQILIVDDIELNLAVASGLLKKTEIKIDTSLSAKNALMLTEKKEYDVIFIDDRMPGMGGVEMLKKLRESKENHNCSKPCIVLTANAVSGAKDKYIKEGFEDYLSKPIDAQELERTLMLYLPKEKVVITRESIEAQRTAAENKESAASIDELKDYIGDNDKLYDAVSRLMQRTGKK